MGDLPQAQQILHGAYAQRPDAEIAAHLGEVLWVMGDKERAARIWREGLLLNPDNATLTWTSPTGRTYTTHPHDKRDTAA